MLFAQSRRGAGERSRCHTGPVLFASSLLWPSVLAGVQHTSPPGVTGGRGAGIKVTHLTGAVAGGHGRSREAQ